MADPGPLFSIITVCYNAGSTISPTLESVRSQTCDLYEHLIIDGASTDDTLSLVSEGATPMQKVVSAPDKGIYDAMNKGLDMAAGEYVIFLNAGDAFHSPDTLQKIADTVMNHDFPGIVYGQTLLVDSERRPLGPRHLQAPENLTLNDFAGGMVVCHQAFVALRRLTGPYNLKWRFSADYEWCIHVLQHSRNNVMLPGTMIDYLHEGMTTRNRRRSLVERFKIMSYYFGLFPTIRRHIGFIPRFLRQRRKERESGATMS